MKVVLQRGPGEKWLRAKDLLDVAIDLIKGDRVNVKK
jgi:hypothetical protein